MISSSRILYFPRPSRLSQYFRSRFRPIDIELETTQAILFHYELELTRPPANLPLSRRTRNVVLITSSGKKVLKLYRSRLRIPNIEYGHSILTRLAQLDFPGPRLVTARNGDNKISHASGNYALFDFVEGVNYSSNFLMRSHRLRLMALAGKTLANLHRKLEGFIPEGHHYLGFSSYSGSWQRDLNWFRDKVADLKEKSRLLDQPDDSLRADWLIRQSAYIFEEFARSDEELEALPLTRLIIHGDYGLHNLVFQKDGTVTPIDFESARLEWRLSDLASCLSRLRYANQAYDFESMQSFMFAYQAEYPIGVDEWRFLPKVWRFHRLRSALIYWNSYFETGGPVRKLVSARDAVSQADWALHHPDQLLRINPGVSI